MKGDDGVPVPHPDTYPGFKMAFETAANGKSHREVARALNGAGYRTTNDRPFTKDTVRGMLQNRFYLGELPHFDRHGRLIEWLPAKHQPFIPLELFEAVEAATNRNRNFPARTTRADARVSSLSGVARCGGCGATLRTYRQRGVARLVCNTRLKGGDCPEKSARLDLYEQRLLAYLEAFHIPPEYQEQLLSERRKLASAYEDIDGKRGRFRNAMARLQEMYQWGHKSRDDYLREFEGLERQLAAIRVQADDEGYVAKLTQFLNSVAAAWKEASEEQRNKLARQLFDGVWIKDQKVEAVTPRPAFQPFFDLKYEGLSKYVLHWRPGGESRSPPTNYVCVSVEGDS